MAKNSASLPNPEMTAFIFCSGSAAGKERFRSSGVSSCRQAVEDGFLRGECKSGCTGLGDCLKACTKNAIVLDGDEIKIDPSKCDGCGDCAAEGVCPQHLIRLIPRKATNFIPCSSTEEDEEKVRRTCGYGCIACGECERICPVGAVKVTEGHAVIDYSKCVGCDACTTKCKKKIIVDTLHDLTVLKDKVAFVQCSGGKASGVFKSLGVQDCVTAAKMDAKALGLCTTGCCGQGTCTAVCRYGALSMVDGVAVVDPDKCVGCRDCTYACPRGIITMVPYKGEKLVACSSVADYPDKAAVCSAGCIACGDCKNNCPSAAIYSEGKHAVVDPDLCEDCNVCQYVCTRGVIHHLTVPDYIYLQRQAMKEEMK